MNIQEFNRIAQARSDIASDWKNLLKIAADYWIARFNTIICTLDGNSDHSKNLLTIEKKFYRQLAQFKETCEAQQIEIPNFSRKDFHHLLATF